MDKEESKIDGERKILIQLYLEDNSLEYEFNLEEEETIITNSLLICGLLEKLKKNLLDVEAIQDLEEKSEEKQDDPE